MASVFIFLQSGVWEIDEQYGQHTVEVSNDPLTILKHCMAERSPYDIFVVEMKHNLHGELQFFRQANLLWHGTPFIIITDDIEVFQDTLRRLGFQAIYPGETFKELLRRKWDDPARVHLDFYGSIAIHLGTDQVTQLPGLIDYIAHDLIVIPQALIANAERDAGEAAVS